MLRLRRSVFLVAVVVAGLLVLPSQSFAGDHHREHSMPPVWFGQLVSVRPGEQVRILAGFSAVSENCIQIYNQGNNAMVAVWNNYDGGRGEWVSPRNTSSGTVVYLVVSRHKDGGPDAGKPWILSGFRVLDGGQDKGTMKIGFEDSNDGDFNDAMVTMTWL